jgi:acyl carrier protein
MEEEMSKEFFMEDLAAILEIEPTEINMDCGLDRSNWNSLAIVAAIALIDEQFGINIEGDKLRECASVGDLWKLIQNAVEAEG